MRLRFLMGAKMLEVLTRGGCILLCTYTLPLVDSGKFGLMVAIVGMLTFLVGYERFIDIQRKVVGLPDPIVYNEIRQALKFFIFQYAAILPVTIIAVGFLVGWSPRTMVLLIFIVIGEHIGNQAYLATLIHKKTYTFLFATVVKNILMLLLFGIGAIGYPNDFDINWVINVWSSASLLLMISVIFLWRIQVFQFKPLLNEFSTSHTVLNQYKASKMHFLAGAVAILAIQCDRFVVGAVLPEADVGVYFRNITLAAIAMQLFSIIFYSRVASDIFQLVREGHRKKARRVLFVEYGRFAFALILSMGVAWIINYILGRPASKLHIEESFLMVFLFGVALRALADYFGLLLLSIKSDGLVVTNQGLGIAFGLPCILFGAAQFGLAGAVLGTLVMPFVLLGTNYLQVRRKFLT